MFDLTGMQEEVLEQLIVFFCDDCDFLMQQKVPPTFKFILASTFNSNKFLSSTVSFSQHLQHILESKCLDRYLVEGPLVTLFQ